MIHDVVMSRLLTSVMARSLSGIIVSRAEQVHVARGACCNLFFDFRLRLLMHRPR